MSPVAVAVGHALLADTICHSLRMSGVEAFAVTDRAPHVVVGELRRRQPAVVLLDLDLAVPGTDAGVVAPLVESGFRVLLVTDRCDPMRVATGLERGALAYHPEQDGFEALLHRTRALLASPTPLDLPHRLALLEALGRERIARAARLAPFLRLTDRERTTLLALAGGRSVTELARAWVVSEATVRSHVRGVLTKLGVPSQLAAVAQAYRSGWLQDDAGISPHAWETLRVPAA